MQRNAVNSRGELLRLHETLAFLGNGLLLLLEKVFLPHFGQLPIEFVDLVFILVDLTLVHVHLAGQRFQLLRLGLERLLIDGQLFCHFRAWLTS